MKSYGLDAGEVGALRRLDTPRKIQDFVARLPANYELRGETYRSPRRVLRDRTAHCFEGALLAAAALMFQGQPPLLLDLKTEAQDTDHVVALFRRRGRWGAISKTNHAVLRYREPIYKDIRELAVSYFHEYFLDSGKKTLRSYSKPFDLRKYLKKDWLIAKEELFWLMEAVDDSPHLDILPRGMEKELRKADPIEIAAGKMTEWTKRGRKIY